VRRYTHLCPEVLVTPPATYTQAADMYSVGIAMYDMWSGRRAYWDELDASQPPVSSIAEFVLLARSVRVTLDDVGDERRSMATSTWRDLMHRCLVDDERISCKAMLQLIAALDRRLTDDVVDDNDDDDDASDLTRLNISDEHFRFVDDR